jgi:CHRD domain-containing protein
MGSRFGGITAVIAAVMLATAGLALGDDGGRPFSGTLSGAEEFPVNPHGDADRGSFALTLNQGQGEVCWSFGALTLTAGEPLPFAAHIHEAPPGVAGDIVVPLFGAPTTPPAPTSYPTGTTCVPADPDLIKEIRQNPQDYYVNLHNETHPTGVVRAQLSK